MIAFPPDPCECPSKSEEVYPLTGSSVVWPCCICASRRDAAHLMSVQGEGGNGLGIPIEAALFPPGS